MKKGFWGPRSLGNALCFFCSWIFLMHIIVLKSGRSSAVKKLVCCRGIRFSSPIWVATSRCLIANNRLPPELGLSWTEQICLRDDVYPRMLRRRVLPPALLCFSLWASFVPRPHPWPAFSTSVSPRWNAAARPLSGCHHYFWDQPCVWGSHLLAQLSLCQVPSPGLTPGVWSHVVRIWLLPRVWLTVPLSAQCSPWELASHAASSERNCNDGICEFGRFCEYQGPLCFLSLYC